MDSETQTALRERLSALASKWLGRAKAQRLDKAFRLGQEMCAEDLTEALAILPPEPAARSVLVWLVERPDAGYWAGDNVWTRDPWKAARYPRRADAQAVVDRIFCGAAVEHSFSEPDPDYDPTPYRCFDADLVGPPEPAAGQAQEPRELEKSDIEAWNRKHGYGHLNKPETYAPGAAPQPVPAQDGPEPSVERLKVGETVAAERARRLTADAENLSRVWNNPKRGIEPYEVEIIDNMREASALLASFRYPPAPALPPHQDVEEWVRATAWDMVEELFIIGQPKLFDSKATAASLLMERLRAALARRAPADQGQRELVKTLERIATETAEQIGEHAFREIAWEAEYLPTEAAVLILAALQRARETGGE